MCSQGFSIETRSKTDARELRYTELVALASAIPISTNKAGIISVINFNLFRGRQSSTMTMI